MSTTFREEATKYGSVTAWRGLRLGTLMLLLAALLALGGCAAIGDKQRQLIYRPTPGMPANFSGLRAGDERFFLTVPATNNSAPNTPSDAINAEAAQPQPEPQRIELWWLPHENKSAPTLLYYHGTFRNLFQNNRKITALREAGFAVLAVDYRGWGLSSPITPSEQTILQDADLAFAELKRREPRASMRVLYGHSMGSGVAVDVASRLQAGTDYGAVILEAAFTSMPDVARQAGWWASLAASLTTENFSSIDKISKIATPLLMIHGDKDNTVPIVLGTQLFDAANAPKQWLAIEGGGHSNLQDVGKEAYQTTLQSFVKKYLQP